MSISNVEEKLKNQGLNFLNMWCLDWAERQWWEEHAIETADVLNKIDPDFIRFRTLKVLKNMPLYEKLTNGDFILPTEEDVLQEERLLIENLDGITSWIKSDHVLNLLEEVDGKLPGDKEKMLMVIDRYFALSDEERFVYRFGRRSGIYRSTDDLQDELTYFKMKKTIKEMESKEPGSVEKTISLLLENYI